MLIMYLNINIFNVNKMYIKVGESYKYVSTFEAGLV